MTKEQTKRPYVTFAIASTLLTLFILSILIINNNYFHILSAQNNNNNTTNSSNSTIVKAATSAKNPSSVNSAVNGVTAMRPTPALTSSNPSNIIESFMSPK